MYRSGELELWNLTPAVCVLTGAQGRFNVVGNVADAGNIERFLYSLNGGGERNVFFRRSSDDCVRLKDVGDFNIDSIQMEELKPNNTLSLRIVRKHLEEKTYEVEFPTYMYEEKMPRFRLDLTGIKYPQQVGQVVDGRWRVCRDESGVPCLEIQAEDAGYDRIILFGRYDWSAGYEITGRVCMTAWTGTFEHGLGIAFKWNPHLGGNGCSIPSQWTTGLGLYYIRRNAKTRDLRISIGVDVHVDKQGRYRGEHILSMGALSYWRSHIGRMHSRIFPGRGLYPHLATRTPYRFRMLVCPEQYALTVWKDGVEEPHPQVLALHPRDELGQGSVGIIAHHCALRLYEFKVSPV